jgi:hypothetical protein
MMMMSTKGSRYGQRKSNPSECESFITKLCPFSESYNDERMLRWSDLQPKLQLHPSEVLLLLDCCYASQAARGSKSPIPDNVELFVACGLNTKTVLPGPQSFTSQLLQEIKDNLKSDGFAKISTIHKNLASRESNLTQSAVYYPLGRMKASITLRPLVASSNRTSPTPPEVGSLTIRLSLSKSEQDALDEIIQWLKLNPPQTVSNIRVEQLRTSANAVGNYISGNSRCTAVAAFSNLPAPARNDVTTTWTTFKHNIARIASYLQSNSSNPTTPDDFSEQNISSECAEELANSFEPVQKAIERNIMAIPELLEKKELLEATVDSQLTELGVGEMLKLRVLAHFMPETVANMELSLPKPECAGLFPSRRIDILPGMPQLGQILIEAKQFDEHADVKVLQTSKTRLQNLSWLLQSSKSKDFHTLECQGFFFEPRQEYGLIWRVPPGSPKYPISLLEIISKKIRVSKKPTLGQRFRIAHKIGTAILKWHLVNWVHQGIASYNIVFFYDEIDGVDYDNPYLCGFEYSRKKSAPSTSRVVEQFELNVYRHPDRQGVPNASHQKEHDIYSYGVLLLELGLWDLVQNLFRSRKEKEISPSDMGKRIQDTARKELGHYAGGAYQRATSICLHGDLGVEQDDKVNSQMAKAFETQVLELIKGGTSID